MSFQIYRELDERVRLPRRPLSHPTDIAARPAIKPTTCPLDLERQIIETLIAAPEPGETIDVSFRRKEQSLRDLFSRLTRDEARSVRDQLVGEHPLAMHFNRLTAERRTRLVASLERLR